MLRLVGHKGRWVHHFPLSNMDWVWGTSWATHCHSKQCSFWELVLSYCCLWWWSSLLMGSPLARVVRLCVQTSTYTQDGRGEQIVCYGEKRWGGSKLYVMERRDERGKLYAQNCIWLQERLCPKVQIFFSVWPETLVLWLVLCAS